MNSAPTSAATKVSALNVPSVAASAVPTSTGATAAGSVRGRAAMSQIRAAEGCSCSMRATAALWALRELREVGPALLLVGLAALLRLVGRVEEEVRVVRELLDAAQPVLGGMEAGLEQPQREGRQREHLLA